MAFDRTTPAGTNPADPGAPAPVRYALDMGHAYVPYDEMADFRLLNGEQQRLLAAWADALIPGNDDWPTASAARAHLYADNCAAKAPRLRALLKRAIDRVEALAMERGALPFAECGGDERRAVLEHLEQSDEAELFEFVLELVFEGYYRDPRVLEVVEQKTGFRIMAPVEGAELEPFDESLVEQVMAREPLLREVAG